MDIDAAMKKLGVDQGSHRVLGLLPLVYVAWADGTVQRAERATILKAARDLGWLAGGGEAVLERWLDTAPTGEELEVGIELLNHLGRTRGGAADEYNADDLHLLLLMCEDVAKAAGGRFGLGEPQSPEELRSLEKIAAALDIKNAKQWQAISRRA